MRFLIFLLLSFNCFAIDHYIQKSSVADCTKSQSVFSGPMAFIECSKLGECIEVKENPYNCNYSQVVPEMIEDKTKPQYSKRVTYECGDNCQSLWDQGAPYTNCLPGEKEAILNLELEQIYCTTLTGYAQLASGREIVTINPALKTAFDNAIAQKQAIKDSIARGKLISSKCQDALAYITDYNNQAGRTIEEITNLQATYSTFIDAITVNRIDLAISELNNVTAPEMQSLKTALLSILQN
ncbi:hypothetical protein HBN50_07855 [Halobacteriovorax sp. GB3]|uniref:hypothetical protein n=1 Tax=Halobacteriovorax sp. GB3 TaxID=2719615 RepID=UPI002360A9C4|nr:hypothetical protein [Halobacteriovorax sp. GB3]MDD0853006.1 hypothetical protein [Halobacteriovorax sp. GB3]